MVVSGSGNVAVYTVEKLLELGATVLTVSDSTGYVYFEEGMTTKLLDAVNTHKVIKRGRLSDFPKGAARYYTVRDFLHPPGRFPDHSSSCSMSVENSRRVLAWCLLWKSY